RTPARLEVAVLVEHAVVGQVVLVVYVHQPAVVDDGGGVVRIVVIVDESDDGGDAPGGRDQLVKRGAVVLDKGAAQDEIFRRVAGDGQLRETDEVDAQLPRPLDLANDAGGVAGEVADGGIDLGQTDA